MTDQSSLDRKEDETKYETDPLDEAWRETDRGSTDIVHSGIQPLFGLMEMAIDRSATDIHIDPVGGQYLIRFRVDGSVRVHDSLPEEDAHKLIMQTRVRANLDFGRSFTPLEGQFKWVDEDMVKDVRVTIIPVNGVDSMHLRILTPPAALTDISRLGLCDADLAIIRKNLARPQGLVIVGGPTGAGKTTTIYSLASTFDLQAMIGVSIEDPVEFNIPYMRQVEVDTKHDFFMHDGLRSLLRMDPDLLLVTEIRDERSAVTAVRAAAAAQYVLTTIHSRDAAAAVEAFHFLSVPYNILGSSLRVIIAQNLVRQLCPSCRADRDVTDEDKALFEQHGLAVPESLFEAKGCDACDRYGYHGRTGIFEVVEIDEEIGKRIIEGTSQIQLRKLFREKGYESIFKRGLRKAAEGETSISELLQLYWPGPIDD